MGFPVLASAFPQPGRSPAPWPQAGAGVGAVRPMALQQRGGGSRATPSGSRVPEADHPHPTPPPLNARIPLPLPTHTAAAGGYEKKDYQAAVYGHKVSSPACMRTCGASLLGCGAGRRDRLMGAVHADGPAAPPCPHTPFTLPLPTAEALQARWRADRQEAQEGRRGPGGALHIRRLASRTAAHLCADPSRLPPGVRARAPPDTLPRSCRPPRPPQKCKRHHRWSKLRKVRWPGGEGQGSKP